MQEVQEMRRQGLSDAMIMDELTKKGMSADEANKLILGAPEAPSMQPPQMGAPQMGAPQMAVPHMGAPRMPTPHMPGPAGAPVRGVVSGVDRTEEIIEGIIDEKWEELLGQVRKIVEWKQMLEDQQKKAMHDLDKLKEDFKTLHEAVLGKIEDYDTRMRDVGTELNAVGKVFKDVVPVFVENVKKLEQMNK